MTLRQWSDDSPRRSRRTAFLAVEYEAYFASATSCAHRTAFLAEVLRGRHMCIGSRSSTQVLFWAQERSGRSLYYQNPADSRGGLFGFLLHKKSAKDLTAVVQRQLQTNFAQAAMGLIVGTERGRRAFLFARPLQVVLPLE